MYTCYLNELWTIDVRFTHGHIRVYGYATIFFITKITNSICKTFQLNVLKQNAENIPNDNLKNKTQQIIKTITIQNCQLKDTTPDDDQKYGWKHLGRRYGTIPIPPGSQEKKNNKTWKITIKDNK